MDGPVNMHTRWGPAKVRLVLLILALALAGPSVRAQETVPAQAVDFTLPKMDGRPFKLSNYRGRWAIINFWATWCRPCLQEIPELIWFSEKYSHKAVVIGVNYETTKLRSVKNFISKQGINYPVVRIGDEPLAPFEPLTGLPSTFFVSPEGDYVARHIGPLTARDIEKFIGQYRGGS
jgi:thiol-disulfide isomerase/thioredoxin